MTEAGIIPALTDWHGDAALHRYVVCDVFTAHPLEGNQLGVFVDGRPFDDEDMPNLARELNFAETVFVLPPSSGGDVAIRIFTPRTELPFAGHPVLGSAFVVAHALGRDTVTLETGAGLVPVAFERAGDRLGRGEMQQPIPEWAPYDKADELLHALGVASSSLPVDVYRIGPTHVFVALDTEADVAALQPDMGALSRLGVAANCFAGKGTAWKTRMFCPSAGVPEDAATGSAAGPLAVHLARHGRIRFGDTIQIRQGEEIGRPSVLYAAADGTVAGITAVAVAGDAVIVAEGRYRID